jgi:hypothetical protein
VTLYEREGCHLCDDARALLEGLVGTGGYVRIDIETDNDLVLRYGFRIPVIGLDGVDRLEAPITADDLRALIAEL